MADSLMNVWEIKWTILCPSYSPLSLTGASMSSDEHCCFQTATSEGILTYFLGQE